MANANANASSEHNVKLTAREYACFTAVTEMLSFDDTCVIMETSLGTLHIEGSSLYVTRLDLATGEAELSGRIDGIYYMEARGKKRRRGK